MANPRSTRLLSFAACPASENRACGGGFLSGRKLRLALAACCRRHAGLFQGLPGIVLETAERYADGAATEDELAEADRLAHEAYGAMLAPGILVATGEADRAANGVIIQLCDPVRVLVATIGHREKWTEPPPLNASVPLMLLARAASGLVAGSGSEGDAPNAYQAELAAQADLVRCIAGNPFTPATLDPTWRTPMVIQLASAAYDERLLPAGHLDPARLAVLSDALEEAGCTDAALLDHLRSPGPHVRGCFAIDLLTGRS